LTLHLTAIWTVVAALLTILLGQRINRALPWLERGSIPPSVTAGLFLSLIFAGLRGGGWLDVRFDVAPRDALLLVFFASLGYGAHLSRIATAGRGALVICLAIALTITAQNGAGILIAKAFGEPAGLGPFLGSIAFAGGHGTAVAWSSTPFAAALPGAFELGIGSATLGLVLGGIIAGPVSVWLATRDGSAARHATLFERNDADEANRDPVLSSDRWLPCLLWFALALAIAERMNAAIASFGLDLPAFLVVLLVSVAITNIGDAMQRPIDTDVTDLIGTIALRIFIAIAMLSLDWVELVKHLPLLFTAALAQTAITVAIAVLVVYLLFGRGAEGAAATGGFIGMSLGAMPVGLAVMRRLGLRFGDTPRALFAITLAASLFTDLANAFSITGFFRWLGM
jgi:glutamate:Na+ symporter, ESS family